MLREHRPYYVKTAQAKLHKLYANRFLRPQFESVGKGTTFVRPWYIEVFGPSIEIGRYANVVAAPDNKIRLSVWTDKHHKGSIKIGDFALVNPGVRISSACEISIGDNAMLANGVYLTDCDWHDTYDRVYSLGNAAAIILKENVWIGDSATVCKGVTIGKNSIVGAGSVVVNDVPPNCVAAGCPATIVKQLDPDKHFTRRSEMLSNPEPFLDGLRKLDRQLLEKNSLLDWLRYLISPQKGD